MSSVLSSEVETVCDSVCFCGVCVWYVCVCACVCVCVSMSTTAVFGMMWKYSQVFMGNKYPYLF
jgi:hypothetical protein